MAKVVSEFAKLIEDEVLRIFLHFIARIVNFLHVAFGTRRANDVAWVARPTIEPVEALLRHSCWQHGNSTCAHDLANGNATARIVAG